ncbi:MAG: 3-deoxy-manno-octulosonate cytidylyltransferase [Gammaproteobacteria bacterium]|nr:3-deoxy-manno-octulosonate cytidylyltransferase [Gammaproteobacteria bacterium]
MTFSVVIPARYGSSRLPGKPLLDIAGKPMVQRVWEQANRSAAGRVIVATDDARIETAARAFGAEVVMTSAAHPSGTDRLQEVARILRLADDEIVVNVQGDEPLIPPAVIDQVASNLRACHQADIATLCEPITTLADLHNPNVVKVVANTHQHALYFSRAPVPWPRDAFAQAEPVLPQGNAWMRHIGVYAYRTAFLHQFVQWPVAPIEQLEQLEQLRALFNGIGIHVEPACDFVPPGVDTEADLALVRAHLLQGQS